MQKEVKNPIKDRVESGLFEDERTVENAGNSFIEIPERASIPAGITNNDIKCEISQEEKEKKMVELFATIIVNHTLRIAYEKGYPLHKV